MTVTTTNLSKPRVTANDTNEAHDYEIQHDGVAWGTGPGGTTMPMIWNNITGANFDTDKEHANYCRRNDIQSGKWALVDVTTKELIATCTITIT